MADDKERVQCLTAAQIATEEAKCARKAAAQAQLRAKEAEWQMAKALKQFDVCTLMCPGVARVLQAVLGRVLCI